MSSLPLSLPLLASAVLPVLLPAGLRAGRLFSTMDYSLDIDKVLRLRRRFWLTSGAWANYSAAGGRWWAANGVYDFISTAAQLHGVSKRTIAGAVSGRRQFASVPAGGCFFCAAPVAIKLRASGDLDGRLVCWSCFYQWIDNRGLYVSV